MPQSSAVVLLSVLCAMSAAAPLAMHMIMPSLPGLQEVFETDYGTVQLSLTLYMVAFAVAQLIVGPLSDRYGRRPVVLAGMMVYLAGGAICMVAPNIEVLVAGRILQASGGCAGYALARSIVRDVYDRDRAASMIAYVTVAMALSPMIGPLIGGYLDVWFGWRSTFAFTLVIGGLITLGIFLGLRETHTERGTVTSAGDMLRSFGHLLSRRTFLGYALSMSVLTGAWFSFLGSAPYVVITLMEREPSSYGLYFMLIAGTFMAGNTIAGRISSRLGIDRMVRIGISLVLLGGAIQAAIVVAGTLTPATFFGPMTIMSIGFGFTIPNAIAGAVSVDPSRAGSASGLVGFLQMGIGAVMAAAVGAMLTDTAVPMVVTMVSMMVLAGAIFLWGTAGQPAHEGRP